MAHRYLAAKEMTRLRLCAREAGSLVLSRG